MVEVYLPEDEKKFHWFQVFVIEKFLESFETVRSTGFATRRYVAGRSGDLFWFFLAIDASENGE
jgi:hypothetical protein